MNGLFYELAENRFLEPEPRRCYVCGSIDVSADGICRHCGTNLEGDSIYEKCENVDCQ